MALKSPPPHHPLRHTQWKQYYYERVEMIISIKRKNPKNNLAQGFYRQNYQFKRSIMRTQSQIIEFNLKSLELWSITKKKHKKNISERQRRSTWHTCKTRKGLVNTTTVHNCQILYCWTFYIIINMLCIFCYWSSLLLQLALCIKMGVTFSLSLTRK